MISISLCSHFGQHISEFNSTLLFIFDSFQLKTCLIIVLYIKFQNIKKNETNRIINIIIWVFVFLFALNTKEVFQTKNGNLILIDDTGIEILNIETFEIWASERISWDGFKDLSFDHNVIKGKTYNPINSEQEWFDFSLNIKSKEIKGGSYRESLKLNPDLD